MDLSEIIQLGTIIGISVTFILGLLQYARQGRQRRVQHFIEMRRRFKENESFNKIRALLVNDSPDLRTLPPREKYDYLGFFEEIAILMNSRQIPKAVVHYMFGLYAIRCWENAQFWSGLDRNDLYWSLFRDFALQMKSLQESFKYNRKKLKF